MKKLSILIVLCLLFTACSTKPIYYTKKEVKEYVKTVYGDQYICDKELSYEDNSDEKNMMYEYVFTDHNLSFSVFTKTQHTSIDASTTIFYSRSIYDNYIEKVVVKHLDELQKLCQSSSLDALVNDNNNVCIYLDNYKQLNECSKLIVDIDQLLSLKYDYTKYNQNKTYSILIYLQPDSKESDWKKNSDYYIDGIGLSHQVNNRLTQENVYTHIERTLVNKIKNTKITYYDISEEILYKYPATRIKVKTINDIENDDYGFIYDTTNDQYWMTSLDPCQDFEDFPYNYTNKSKFKKLVELLGGTYECDNYSAKWIIDNHIWQAKLVVDDDYNYKDFIVTLNGKKIYLSDYNSKNNGTVSGRAFTVSDLEKMLNIDIEIDQKEMSATMKSK